MSKSFHVINVRMYLHIGRDSALDCFSDPNRYVFIFNVTQIDALQSFYESIFKNISWIDSWKAYCRYYIYRLAYIALLKLLWNVGLFCSLVKLFRMLYENDSSFWSNYLDATCFDDVSFFHSDGIENRNSNIKSRVRVGPRTLELQLF